MRTLALAVLTLVMVGCTTTQGRFDHRAKAQRVDRQHHSAKFQHDSVRNRHAETGRRLRGNIGETVHVQERYEEAFRKIRQAVADGTLTKEEAKKKIEALRKRMGKGFKHSDDREQRRHSNSKRN